MERRLLKDFQIGIVEGIVKDVLTTEPEPKDVFSQIAKAIGRRSNSTRYFTFMSAYQLFSHNLLKVIYM